MEQDKHAVLDLSEGKEQGTKALTADHSGEVTDAEGLTRGAASMEPEVVSAMDNGNGVASESSKNEDLEGPLTEPEGVAAMVNDGHGAVSGSAKNEDYDYEVFKNPTATRFEFRATAANAIPPSTYRRLPSRSRKHLVPTHFISAGATAASAGSEAPVLDTSSPASVTGPQEDVSAMANACQGAAPVRDKNTDDGVVKKQRAICFEFGATATNATPSSTYRRLPSRSRKQAGSTHFIAAEAAASAGANAHVPDKSQTASDPPPSAILGFTLPSASVTRRSGDISAMVNAGEGALSGSAKNGDLDVLNDRTTTRSDLDATAKSSTDVKDAAAPSSYRLPSRGRKQPRPDRFIPEEAEASARAKARRSNVVLDRFLSSLVDGSSEPRPDWVRNTTAHGVRNQRGIEGFKIRDVNHYSARVRELRSASDPSSSARRGSAMPAATAPRDPEEPDESGMRISSVLAILGASLALTVVSCVLFYIVGHGTESDLSGEQHKK